MGIFLKDPDALLDYSVDWAAGYLDGQTIAASDWAVEPAGGVTVVSTVLAPTRTGATLSGGVPGNVYRVANRVTLSDGRRDERGLTLRCEQR